MKLSLRSLPLATALALMAGTAAGAEPADQAKACGAADSEVAVAACTALIDGGTLSAADAIAVYLDRALAYEKLGRIAEARPDYDKAMELRLDNSSPGDSLVGTRDRDEKPDPRSTYQPLLKDPDDVLARYDQAKSEYDRRNYHSAIRDYDRVLARAPSLAHAWAGRADAHRELEHKQEAIADYTAAIDLNPDYRYALGNRCWSRAMWNMDLDAALTDCNKALELEPGSFETLDSRALVYFRLGDYSRAIRDDAVVTENDPHAASALYLKGIAKLRVGDVGGGNADVTRAKTIDRNVARTYASYGITP